MISHYQRAKAIRAQVRPFEPIRGAWVLEWGKPAVPWDIEYYNLLVINNKIFYSESQYEMIIEDYEIQIVEAQYDRQIYYSVS
jgi:hypothetical protein